MWDTIVWLVLLAAPREQACLVLEAWDTARSQAWAAGSPADLTRLYDSPRSAAPDVRLLESWVARDLRVRGLALARHDCRVVATTATGARVRVRERVGAGQVVFADGTTRRLPQDTWTLREIDLVHRGTWQVAASRDLD